MNLRLPLFGVFAGAVLFTWRAALAPGIPLPSAVGQVPNKLITGAAKKTNNAILQKNDPYWQRAQIEVYRSIDELNAQDAREQRRGTALPKLSRGNPKKKLIALTFDDGPHPQWTPKLLALLDKLQVKATFFVVGKMVEKYPMLTRDISTSGHEIGNHTFSHVTLTKIPEPLIETEYRANNDLLKRITGKTPRYCRPPGGDYDKETIQAAQACGLTTVLWTDDPGDYAKPSTQVLTARTMRKISNGGIILLHDGIPESMEMLPKIVAYCRSRGLQFVTISQLDAQR